MDNSVISIGIKNRWVYAFILVSCCFLISPLSSEPRYTDDADAVFWFMVISDVHCGALEFGRNVPVENLGWALGEANRAIDPEFIVNCGDLTDSTNGGILPAQGPFQEEWDMYSGVLSEYGMRHDFYYDLPGNHDAYNDFGLTYYLANSMQGQATGKLQYAWEQTYDFGRYSFFAVNTADRTGGSWGSNRPGLRPSELQDFEALLYTHRLGNLRIVFGHHPISFFKDGAAEFTDLLHTYNVNAYIYGHTHLNFVSWMDGILSFNISSLSQDLDRRYAVFAIDNDAISYGTKGVWELGLLIVTAPWNVDLAGGNPHAYLVSRNSPSNPVRALFFDSNPPRSVQYSLNHGLWQPMEEVREHLYQGWFDARQLDSGRQRLQVKAITSESEVIKVETWFETGICQCDDGIDNNQDGFTDYPDDPNCYSRHDPLEDPTITATPTATPYRSPTPTVTPTSTATRIPNQAPKIVAGGYLGTELDGKNGGELALGALVSDPDGMEDVYAVQVFYMGNGTGLYLEPDPYSAGYFELRAIIAPAALPPSKHLLELVAEDRKHEASELFPYLIVDE